MDLVILLIYFVIFGCVVWFALSIVERAFPEPVKMPAKAIVGLIALVVLLSWFLGGGHVALPAFNR